MSRGPFVVVGCSVKSELVPESEAVVEFRSGRVIVGKVIRSLGLEAVLFKPWSCPPERVSFADVRVAGTVGPYKHRDRAEAVKRMKVFQTIDIDEPWGQLTYGAREKRMSSGEMMARLDEGLRQLGYRPTKNPFRRVT